MKLKHLKKALSITLATAMLVTSVPVGTVAEEGTEASGGTGSGSGSGSEGEAGTGSGSGNEGEAGTGSGSENEGEAGTGSGSGSEGEEGTGSGNGNESESGTGSGSANEGEGEEGTGSGNEGESGTVNVLGNALQSGVPAISWSVSDGYEVTWADASTALPDAGDITVTVDGAATSDYTAKVTYTTGSGDTISDSEIIKQGVGTYYAVVALEDSEGTAVSSFTGAERLSFTVAACEVSVSWSYESATYTGSAIALPTASVTLTHSSNQTIDAEVSFSDSNVTEMKDAGSYDLTADVSLDLSGEVNGTDWSKYYKINEDSKTLSFTVNPQELPVTWSSGGEALSGTSLSVVYNAADQQPTASAGSGTEPYAIVTSIEDGTGAAVSSAVVPGTYTLTVSAAQEDENFKLTNTVFTLTITKAEAAVTWAGSITAEYSGSAITAPTASTTVGDVTVTITDAAGAEVDEIINAGTYTLTAALSEEQSALYTLTNETVEVTVSQKDVTVESWSGDTFSYNGEVQYPVATINDVTEAELTYTVTDESENTVTTATVPGTYTVTVSSGNYRISGDSKTFTVNKKEITALSWSAETAVYSGEKISLPTATFEDVKDNEVQMSVSFTDETVSEMVNVGAYSLTAALSADTSDTTTTTSLSVDQLYVISADCTNATITFTVTPLEVEVVWSGETEAAYNGASHSLTPSATDDNDNEYEVTVDTITKDETEVESGDVILPGKYTFTATTTNTNITLKESTKAAVLTIGKASVDSFVWPSELSATFSDGEITLPVVTFAGVDGSLINATVNVIDAETAENAAEGTMVNADTYTLKASIPTNVEDETTGLKLSDLYEVSESCTNDKNTFAVEKKTVEVTWSGETVVAYDGEAHELTLSAADSDGNTYEVTVDTITKDGTEIEFGDVILPGEYTFTATTADANITLEESTISAVLTIGKASVDSFAWPTELSATFSDGAITLPVVTFEGVDGSLIEAIVAVTSENNTNGNMVNAGEYILEASVPDEAVDVNDPADSSKEWKLSDLYEISESCTDITNTFTVGKKTVEVTWSGETKVAYDGGSHELTPSVTDSNGNTYEVTVDTIIKDTDTELESGDVVLPGEYTFTATTANTNITLKESTKAAILTIEKASVDSFTWPSDLSATFSDGVIVLPVVTFEGVDGSLIEATVAVTSANNTNGSMVNAGEYTLEASVPDEAIDVNDPAGSSKEWKLSDLYEISESCTDITNTFTVGKKTVEVTWSGETKVAYDGGSHELTPSVTDSNGNTYEVTVDTIIKDTDTGLESGDVVLPGEYTFTATTADTNITLKESTKTAVLTIGKASVDSFTWPSDLSATFSDGMIALPVVTFEGVDGSLIEATVAVISKNNTDGNMVNAGEYTLEASVPDEAVDVNDPADSSKEWKLSDLYEISESCTDITNTFTIGKKTVAVIWSGEMEVAYDGETHVLIPSASADGYTYDVSIVTIASITEDESEDVTSGGAVLPGTYVFTATTGNTNIELTNTTSGELTITKAQITAFKWQEIMSAVYANQEIALPSAVFTGVNGSVIEATVTMIGAGTAANAANGTMINADTYTLQASVPTDVEDETTGLLLSDLYEIADPETCENITAEYTVDPLAITVKADSQSKYYHADEPELTYKIDGIPESGTKVTDTLVREALTVSFAIRDRDGAEVTAQSGVGRDYTIEVSAVENNGTSNYAITCVNGTLTINPVEISLAANNIGKIYGEEDPELTYDVVINTEDYIGTEGDAAEAIERIKSELGDILVRSLVEDGAEEADESNGENVGSYAISFTSALDSVKNYEINETEGATFTISRLGVTVTAVAKSKYYGKEEDPELTYTVEIASDDKTEAEVRAALGETPLVRDAGETAGDYEIRFIADPTNYEISYVGAVLTILPLPVSVYAVAGQSKLYSEDEPEYYDYYVEIGEEESENLYDTDLTAEAIQDELNADLRENEYDILQRESGSIVGTYGYSLTEQAENHNNYALTYVDEGACFEILELPVTITADAGQSKYYGGDGPFVYTYTVTNTSGVTGTLEPDEIVEELRTEFELDVVTETTVFLKRAAGENAGTYDLSLVFDEMMSWNFAITYVSDVFTVKQLPVTIVPDSGQKKTFGAKEPDFYTYTAVIGTTATNRTAQDVQSELGNYVLERAAGEAIGNYAYSLIADPTSAETHFANFELTVAADAPSYEIMAINITAVESITSRQTSFGVTTDLTGERQSGVTTKIRIEAAEYPTSADGITFSQSLDDYITGASEGIVFTGASDTLVINKATYQRARKDTEDESLSWDGYLPAGTVLKVSIVDGEGNTVSAAPVTVTVSPVSVSFYWDSNSYSTSSTTGNYVVSNNGTTEALSLAVTAGSAGTGELAELAYSKDSSSTVTYSYGTLGLTFTPQVNNSGNVHVIQSVKANIVDTLNLTCESKALSFYVDDSAFTIPSTSISFENRGDSISITLPEVGTINSVTINGGTVSVSSEMGQTFTLPVEWSGENLITSGTTISVTYTDQAGHQGTGTGTVTRSSVATPITFTIRPELNSAGYLNGSSSTLIISGTACACEPILVTVAGVTQTTYATQSTVWSDSNGSWEVVVSMSSLPDGESFDISAEYVDVSGTAHSITANYNEYCAEAALLSPVYEAMTHLSGLVEPGTAVALVINGDTQNYYELAVDQYGHFSTDEVPMLFAEEDSFDIYVTDIAGNVSIAHFEIEDYDETSSVVSPLGKFIYTEEASDTSGYVALPVSASDFASDEEGGEDLESIELPLLWGASYVVGTFTVNRTENGFTVSSAIELDEELIDPEDYSVEDIALLVFTSEPTAAELKDIEDARESGNAETLANVYASYENVYEAAYGEEISFGSNGTAWIVSEQEMSILTDAIEELELYQYMYDEIDEDNEYDVDMDRYDDLYKSYQER